MAKRRDNSRESGRRKPGASTSRKRAPARPERSVRGEFEKGFYIAVLSFAVALSALLAHGSAYSIGSWPGTSFEHRSIPIAESPVFGRAMVLEERYDSRPYWHNQTLVVGAPTDRATADLAIEHLIPCESGGKAVDHLDSNGKMSYGILQFQDWREWERISGITGDPENSDDAIRMAEWGIEHGMIDHWGCARILGEIHG
jgi:hypothetical protein